QRRPGTHNHRPLLGAPPQPLAGTTTLSCGYGSLLSQGRHRRMGRAQRNPSSSRLLRRDGFRCALPILRDTLATLGTVLTPAIVIKYNYSGKETKSPWETPPPPRPRIARRC